ncbi:MAG: hypothetical protein EF812_05705 [Methanosarcinales archaeon]|nr:MAG: hypothetical protein EF812_05705 [Methanosarcinales archaeon]
MKQKQTTIMIVLLVIAMVVVPIASAEGAVAATVTIKETPAVSIGSADDVSNGADVTVPINITSASNIGAMDISIMYDISVLNATGVENGTFNITIMAYNIDAAAGRINISFAEYPNTLTGDGVLFNLRFAAIGAGNSTLDITVKEAWTGDVPPQPVTPITVDGYVNVTGGVARIPGDANGDTNVNIQDAVLLFNWVSFPGDQGTKYVLQKPENANVNGDTVTNIQDAVLLFNWVSFPGDQGTKYVLQ